MRLGRIALAAALAASLSAPAGTMPAAAAQSPMLAGPAAGAAGAGLTQVGVTAAVRGPVEVATPGAVGRVVRSGEAVFLGDQVKTGPEARLQILLLDETVFTIGPNSALVIDTFVYDPATHDGVLNAQVIKGAFRFVSGNIAHKKPENMKVKLPSGMIGVRGTIAAGRVDGPEALVVLVAGGINVSSDAGGQSHSVDIDQPGFGTTVSDDAPPSEPAPVPAEALDSLSSDLSAPPADDADGGYDGSGDAGDASGYDGGGFDGDMAETFDSSGGEDFGSFDFSSYFADLAESSIEAAQDAADSAGGIADGISTYGDLTTIETGQFYYHGVGGFSQTLPVQKEGTTTVYLDIDFGARTIGGGNSILTIESTSGGGTIPTTSMNLASAAFGDDAEQVILDSATASMEATFTINNANGVAGDNLDVTVEYDSSGFEGTGYVDQAERASGLSP